MQGVKVLGLGLSVSGSRVQVLGFGIQGLGFREGPWTASHETLDPRPTSLKPHCVQQHGRNPKP